MTQDFWNKAQAFAEVRFSARRKSRSESKDSELDSFYILLNPERHDHSL